MSKQEQHPKEHKPTAVTPTTAHATASAEEVTTTVETALNIAVMKDGSLYITSPGAVAEQTAEQNAQNAAVKPVQTSAKAPMTLPPAVAGAQIHPQGVEQALMTLKELEDSGFTDIYSALQSSNHAIASHSPDLSAALQEAFATAEQHKPQTPKQTQHNSLAADGLGPLSADAFAQTIDLTENKQAQMPKSTAHPAPTTHQTHLHGHAHGHEQHAAAQDTAKHPAAAQAGQKPGTSSPEVVNTGKDAAHGGKQWADEIAAGRRQTVDTPGIKV